MTTCHKADINYLLNPSYPHSSRTATKYDRPYKCGHCERAFRERGNLNKHVMSVHQKQKSFSCHICPKSFAFKDGLLRHISTVHDNQRRYVCGACKGTFKQQSHLAKHLRTVHKRA